jgi:hypothetical protein
LPVAAEPTAAVVDELSLKLGEMLALLRLRERGWTARLTVDDEVVVYCPECDEREFGEVQR